MIDLTPESWMTAALCAQSDPDAWHPEPQASVVDAKRICGTCPALASCFEWALRTSPQHGIYAGMTVNQLRRYKRAVTV